MNLKNRNITVLGLGRSGFESAKFLCERGARVFVSEFKSTEHFLNCKNELEPFPKFPIPLLFSNEQKNHLSPIVINRFFDLLKLLGSASQTNK